MSIKTQRERERENDVVPRGTGRTDRSQPHTQFVAIYRVMDAEKEERSNFFFLKYLEYMYIKTIESTEYQYHEQHTKLNLYTCLRANPFVSNLQGSGSSGTRIKCKPSKAPRRLPFIVD